MKKYLYLSAAALATLFATSCSSDDVPASGEDGMTTFRVKLPAELTTRAFGDGQSAKKLYVAIYDADAAADAKPLFSNFPGGDSNGMIVTDFPEQSTTENPTTTVTVNLVKNKSYKIAFWAQNPTMTETGGAFTYSATGRTISVDYTKLACNTEDADAFYNYIDFQSGVTSSDVTLTRPFAQINIGTDDVAAAKKAGLDVQTQGAGMNISGVANVLNFSDGSTSGTADVTYAAKALPDATNDGAFPAGNTYTYLTMGYVLVPGANTNKGTTNVSLVIPNAPQSPFATYPNVPIQSNYRTNIYGSLLTNPEVFTVEIKPAFTDNINKEIVTVSTPEEFVTAAENGQDIIIPDNTTVDLSGLSEPDASGNVEPITLAGGTTLHIEGTLKTGRSQLAVSEGTVEVTGKVAGQQSIRAREAGASQTSNEYGFNNNNGTLVSIGTKGNRPINLYGGTLIIKDLNVYTTQNNGGSSIFTDGGTLELENVNVKCSNFALGLNGNTQATANNCVFESDSNNREGAFSYTLSAAGTSTIDLYDCVVSGIQGGVVSQGNGAVINIYSGTYETRPHPQYGAGIAFYAAYACNNGIINIYGGTFTTADPNKPSVYESDNDTNEPLGYIRAYGGKFGNSKWGYNNITKEDIVPMNGYKAVKLDGNPYFWEIVKEN